MNTEVKSTVLGHIYVHPTFNPYFSPYVKVEISGYGNLQTMSTNTWATSKSHSFQQKLGSNCSNALKLNFEAL